jgi:anti-sigma factor RsiW
MTEHLSSILVNGLVDGELSANQLASANQHLAECPACTSQALFQTLLKSATAKAGQKYTPPLHLQERLTRLVSEAANPQAENVKLLPTRPSASPADWRFGLLGWAVAAAIFFLAVSTLLVERAAQRARIASAQRAVLVTEVSDQHIATLAANLPPQVLSSDRHTVKPWFQGKLPFSFNLPDNLPRDTSLDGANLTYLLGHPVAQLLYSIGKHRVSVFVTQNSGASDVNEMRAEHAGFHVIAVSTGDLRMVAASDVDSTRLSELVTRITQAQTPVNPQ